MITCSVCGKETTIVRYIGATPENSKRSKCCDKSVIVTPDQHSLERENAALAEIHDLRKQLAAMTRERDIALKSADEFEGLMEENAAKFNEKKEQLATKDAEIERLSSLLNPDTAMVDLAAETDGRIVAEWRDSHAAIEGLEEMCWNTILSYHMKSGWFVAQCASVMPEYPVVYFDTPLAAVNYMLEKKGYKK